jgi:type 1 fimbriae regulatory protein FimB/type 1 fimbriae regulatory protein FimE
MKPCSNAVLKFPAKLVPTIVNRKVPLRRKNVDYRSREYLTEEEVDLLISAAGKVGRHGHRDSTLILLSYRHGLRVTELISMRWEQLDLKQGLMHVNRLKHGNPSVHPLRGPELRALRRLQRDYSMMPYVFSSERKAPLSSDAIRKIFYRAGVEAKMPFTVHPHMLRHACGYKLAQDGQDTRAIQHYLGHKNIQHTVRYTQLSPDRFKEFWKD